MNDTVGLSEERRAQKERRCVFSKSHQEYKSNSHDSCKVSKQKTDPILGTERCCKYKRLILRARSSHVSAPRWNVALVQAQKERPPSVPKIVKKANVFQVFMWMVPTVNLVVPCSQCGQCGTCGTCVDCGRHSKEAAQPRNVGLDLGQLTMSIGFVQISTALTFLLTKEDETSPWYFDEGRKQRSRLYSSACVLSAYKLLCRRPSSLLTGPPKKEQFPWHSRNRGPASPHPRP